MKLASCIILVFVSLSGLNLQAQDFSVDARLSTNEILIGDQVELRIGMSYPPNVKLKSIDLEALKVAEGIEIVDVGQVDTASVAPMYNVEQRIRLTAFDSGVYYIPPIPVEYLANGATQSATTDRLQLIISTIPVMVTDSTDIQPIKDIIREPIGIQDVAPYLLGAILLAMIVAAIVYFIRRNRRPSTRVEAPAPPPPPAHEIAFRQLEALQEKDYLSQRAFKTFQVELTHILREYLENRYHIAALESTTPEILSALAPRPFPESWKSQLRTMLEKADLVKFAKAELPLDFHRESIERLRQFVEETREVTAPQTEDSDTSENEPEP